MQKQAEKALLPTSTGFAPTSLTSKVRLEDCHCDPYTSNVEDQDSESSVWNMDIKTLLFQDDVNLPKHFVMEDTIIEVKNCMPAVPPGKYDSM